ncbi:hypothetical protein ACQ4PT_040316 [Festuca glaucescens]
MIAARYATAVVLALVLLPLPAAVTLKISCDGSVYTANGTFQANLDLLAAALPANASASPSGFVTASVGAAPDQANALALCRGDTNASACAACVAAAFQDAQQACPQDKGVAVYSDACVLRFAGTRFLDFLQGDQWLVSELVPVVDTATGSVNASDACFRAAVTAIFTALVDRAVAGTNGTRKYFATGEMDFDPKLYGLAQCAPDLTPAQCQGCLGQLFRVTELRYLSARPLSLWTSAFVVWCSLRYGVSPFHEGRAMLQLAAPPAPAPAPSPEATITPPIPESGAALEKIGRAHCTIFDLPTLQQATEHFSERNKLGEGGFGTIYKGILSDGQVIAVKTLLGTTGHGLQQLHNEVVLLAELQHKNLVSGYMAPEYAMHGNVSPKIDVFSLGVLALEIVTRRSNCSSNDHGTVNLLSDVWDHWTKGTISQMLHGLDGYARNQALRCIHIGLLCVQQDPGHRPDISAVVFMLTRDSMELRPPSQPAFFFGRASRSNGQSSYLYDQSDFVLQQSFSVNGITLTEPYPR